MGYLTVFYVPELEASFQGRAADVSERFWHLGILLDSEDPSVAVRISALKAKNQPLPESPHRFSYSSIAVVDLIDPIPVPFRLWDLACPHCGEDVLEAAYDAWGSPSDSPMPERQVLCPSCGVASASDCLKSQSPFTLASFYISVADIDEENWDPSFKSAVESVLGACREYRSWDT